MDARLEFKCPLCRDVQVQNVIVDYAVVTQAKRFPTIVTAVCARKHNLLLFVTRDLKVVDVQEALGNHQDKKDVVENTRGYFESF